MINGCNTINGAGRDLTLLMKNFIKSDQQIKEQETNE